METNNLDKEIGFIAKHYKAGLFDTEKTLSKIKKSIRKVWSFQRIAGIVCIIAVLGATAGVIINNSNKLDQKNETQEVPVELEIPGNREEPKETISKIIDFDNAPLSVVINRIQEVYDVEVKNIPEDADEYKLSLHYEGNVYDLIETINDILGTKLEIEK